MEKFKPNRFQNIELSGVVAADCTDQNGLSAGYILITNNEDKYHLEPTWTGRYVRLCDFLKKNVSVKGELRIHSQEKIIFVNNIAESETEGRKLDLHALQNIHWRNYHE